MPARSLAAKMSAAFFLSFVTLLILPLGEGCTSTCSSASDCSGGDVCLYPPGSGCFAKGHCGQHESCVAQITGIPLCSCQSGLSLNLFCAPNDGIAEPTTSGSCSVPTDAAPDAVAASEAGFPAEAGATTDAGATPDAEAVADAGGQ